MRSLVFKALLKFGAICNYGQSEGKNHFNVWAVRSDSWRILIKIVRAATLTKNSSETQLEKNLKEYVIEFCRKAKHESKRTFLQQQLGGHCLTLLSMQTKEQLQSYKDKLCGETMNTVAQGGHEMMKEHFGVGKTNFTSILIRSVIRDVQATGSLPS